MRDIYKSIYNGKRFDLITDSQKEGIIDTTTFHTISNLQSGKEYAFRVTVISSDYVRVYPMWLQVLYCN